MVSPSDAIALTPLPDEPLLTVISIVYNHEKLVERSIESVLAQDWPHDRFQYVMVDDGSTDRTPDVVARYGDQVHYIRQENQGVIAAVNRAIEEARGDVIAGCSGDDEWPAGRARRQIDFLHEHPDVGLVYGDMEVIDEESRTIAPSFYAMNRLEMRRGRPLGRLLKDNFVSGGSCMLRGQLKPVFHPIPPEAAWEDWWWAWSIARVADIDYVTDPVYRYRMHSGNFSFGVDAERQVEITRMTLDFRRWMLGQLRPGDATPHEVLEGARNYVGFAASVAAATRQPLSALAVASGDGGEHARANLSEAASALALGDVETAVAAAAHAISADPASTEALELLTHAAQTPPAPSPIDNARGFRVVADADELVERPELLRAYGSRFSGWDDATLVILALGWTEERLAGELAGVVAAAAVDGDDSADMLAAPVTEHQREQAMSAADAVLSDRADARDEPPCFGAADADALRALAERRWAGLGALASAEPTPGNPR